MRLHLELLLAVVMTLAGTACQKPRRPVEPEKSLVETTPVQALANAGFPDSTPEYIAAVRANEETDFSFKVGGVIELVGKSRDHSWEEGNPVTAGTVLARLQQSDFKNALAVAKASAGLAAVNLERISKLLAGSSASKQENDKARADAEMANGQLDQAQQNLRDSELIAPWDGVIFTRYVNPGETTTAGKPILRFGDIRTMSVELGVPDRLVGQFKVGAEIDVDISAFAGRAPFKGHISEVGVAASREGRLYRVVIKVPNPDGLLKSGMTATVRAGVLTEPGKNDLVIPLPALVAAPMPGTSGGKSSTQLAVFVVRDGKAVLRPIKTGDIIASSVIVTDGLAEGEKVVTRGTSQLYDGAPVVLR